PDEPWAGQVARVREWFEPHLERIYQAAQVRAADLLQLEHIAQQFATRERFLTELALDPPQATSDLAGPPLLDEDWLVLSTIHSAKGQEWDSVYVLNVTDGNFPSDFSTSAAELIEEERRLLYVAMTRAQNSLHLLVPLRFYVGEHQYRGDAHVYGTRSRFISQAVLGKLDKLAWPPADAMPADDAQAAPSINVGQRLRNFWM